MPVPISLDGMNGCLHTGNKSLLSDMLTKDVSTLTEITLCGTSCLVIDGQALVMALGKLHGATTFGQYANVFIKSVFDMGISFDRIDVTFDRYQKDSIKSGTRMKRTHGNRPIRRVIESRSTPLPDKWSNFVSLGENKANLAEFLSKELVESRSSHTSKTLVVAGGFADITEVQCTDAQMDTTLLQANHEEADTRLILHAVHTNAETVVVSARDTDVLVLLIAHLDKMRCSQLWMKAGTSKKPKCIPVHTIHQGLSSCQVKALLSFHALTGCDTVSHLAGHTKKAAWKVFQEDSHLLTNLGAGDGDEDTFKAAEKLVCRMYKLPVDVNTCDKARVMLFCKGVPKKLFHQHLMQHKYTLDEHITKRWWKQAIVPIPVLSQVTDSGWNTIDDRLLPKLMTLPPITETCKEVVTCSCTTACQSQRCSCRRGKLQCTDAFGQEECRNKHD